MNKIFFTICFTILLSLGNTSFARVSEVSQLGATPTQATEPPVPLNEPVSGMPDPENLEEVISFFKQRIEMSPVSKETDLGQLGAVGITDVQHSQEYVEQLANENKSIFEKIYDQAIKKISGSSNQEETAPQELSFYELIPTQTQTDSNPEDLLPNIDVVNVELPGGRKVLAPAREHIPYLLVSLNILPNGLIEVNEEITVIANAQKLKNGLKRIIPKFTTSRAGVRKKLDITLLQTEINNQNIAHILEEIGDNYYIKAKEDYQLPPGVYTYHFRYLVNRKIWQYDDFAELYWDIVGNSWNLVVTSANAVISVPNGQKFLGQNLLIGQGKNLYTNRAVIVSLAENALGFASTTPLLPTEGMHVLVSLDKSFFLKPDLNQYLTWFITDYGTILIALFGFMAVLGSYILSWRYLKKNKPRLFGSFKLTAPLWRSLIKGGFDKRSFVCGILELYRKNIIDIQAQDSTLMLIKRTDQTQNLNQGEKNMLKHFFGPHDSVITLNAQNMLKFKRAEAALGHYTKRMLNLLKWQLNIGYLFFSVLMLISTEIGIAGLSVNPWQTGLILISCTATLIFYIFMLRIPFKNKIKRYILKSISLFFLGAAILFAGVYIGFISALFIAATIFVIFEYSALFGKRGGLLKSKIKEAEELSRFLQSHAGRINTTAEFSLQQPNIFAFDLTPFYKKNVNNAPNYKLDFAEVLEKTLQKI